MGSDKRQREAAWLTIRELSDALDVSQTYCRQEVLRCVPAEAKEKHNGRWRVHGRTAIEAYLLDRLRRRLAPEPIFDDAIPEILSMG